MNDIDKTDMKILDVLKEDARISVREISKKCGVPPATVHKRKRKLEKEGVIEKYVAVINKAKLGKGTLAYVLVSIKPEVDYTSMMEDMEKREEVESMGALAGQFDIILKVRVRNIEDLDNLVLQYIRKFPEVAQTQTLIVFKHWH